MKRLVRRMRSTAASPPEKCSLQGEKFVESRLGKACRSATLCATTSSQSLWRRALKKRWISLHARSLEKKELAAQAQESHELASMRVCSRSVSRTVRRPRAESAA